MVGMGASTVGKTDCLSVLSMMTTCSIIIHNDIYGVIRKEKLIMIQAREEIIMMYVSPSAK